MMTLRFTALAVVAFALSGCTAISESFPGHDEGQVWTALLAVAETPDYSDPDPARRWWVKENVVHVVPEQGRIEIYRELDRVLHRPGTQPDRQFQTWKLQVEFTGGKVPSATIRCRNAAIPLHAREEMQRYFASVKDVLGGLPTGTTGAAPVPADRATERPADQPLVNPEDLEVEGG